MISSVQFTYLAPASANAVFCTNQQPMPAPGYLYARLIIFVKVQLLGYRPLIHFHENIQHKYFKG
jgi:hypothetical protein